MLNWLKYAFGNFFSHKLSKEGPNRSLWNLLFSLLIYLVLLTSFLASGYTFSFHTHYNKATSFHEFAHNVFCNGDVNKRVNLEVSEINDDEVSLNAFYNLDKDAKVLINTFDNESDSLYKVNDYNLIVDTRDSTNTFVEFEVTYYNQFDENDTITADEYRELSGRSNYLGKVDVSKNLVSYTDEQISEYLSWLNIYVSKLESNNEFVEEFAGVKKLDNTSKEYKDGIYSLYTRAYYTLSVAPTIQTYYQSVYAVLDENNEYIYQNYLIITDNWCLVSFTSDEGINVTYDGYYTSLDKGFTISSKYNSEESFIYANIDSFFGRVFDSVSAVKSLMIGVNAFRFYPFVILSMLVLGAFIFFSCKIKKREYAMSYLGGLKIASGYLCISTLIGSLIGFIASFVTSQQIAYAIGTWGTLIVLLIRGVIFVILEEKKVKDDIQMAIIDEALGIKNEEPIEVKIKKESIQKIDEDDEFKMGKM